MPKYVDGFVMAVPRKKMSAYVALAKKAARIWKEHGALEYVECVGVDVPKGKVTSFPRSVKLKAGEVVFFSWITYKSRAHRDRVVAKAMKDPRLAEAMDPENLPFDGMRMIFGGFERVLDL